MTALRLLLGDDGADYSREVAIRTVNNDVQIVVGIHQAFTIRPLVA